MDRIDRTYFMFDFPLGFLENSIKPYYLLGCGIGWNPGSLVGGTTFFSRM